MAAQGTRCTKEEPCTPCDLNAVEVREGVGTRVVQVVLSASERRSLTSFTSCASDNSGRLSRDMPAYCRLKCRTTVAAGVE